MNEVYVYDSELKHEWQIRIRSIDFFSKDYTIFISVILLISITELWFIKEHLCFSEIPIEIFGSPGFHVCNLLSNIPECTHVRILSILVSSAGPEERVSF